MVCTSPNYAFAIFCEVYPLSAPITYKQARRTYSLTIPVFTKDIPCKKISAPSVESFAIIHILLGLLEVGCQNRLQMLTAIDEDEWKVSFMETSEEKLLHLLVFMAVLLDRQRRTQYLSHLLSSDLCQDLIRTSGKHLPFQTLIVCVWFPLHDHVGASYGWNIDFDHLLEKICYLYGCRGKLLLGRISCHDFYEADKEHTVTFHCGWKIVKRK